MMDTALHVANAYAPTSDSGALLFQSYWDLLVAQDEAPGMDLKVLGVVTAAATSAGSATIRAVVVGNASDNTFNGGTLAGGGNVILGDTTALAFATWAVQYQFFRLTISRQALQGVLEDLATSNQFLRYLTVGFVIGTANLTGGVFDAWFHFGSLQDTMPYQSGYGPV